VNFAVITFCVVSQRVMPKVSVYFVIDSVRKLLVVLGDNQSAVDIVSSTECLLQKRKIIYGY
jgi:hypothetical protein